MKRLLLILMFLLPALAFGQKHAYFGTPTTIDSFNLTMWVRQFKMPRVPLVNSYFDSVGSVYLNTTTGTIYFHDGSGWQPIAGGGGGGGLQHAGPWLTVANDTIYFDTVRRLDYVLANTDLKVPTAKAVRTALGDTSLNLRAVFAADLADTAAAIRGDMGTVKFVGVSLPPAFSVTPTAITDTGTFTVTVAGNSAQYIDGTGSLAAFPATGAVIYMFTDSTTAIPSYNRAVLLSDYVPKPIATNSATATTTETLLGTFVTDTVGVAMQFIPVGNIGAHYETEKSAGGNNYFTFFKLYKRNSGGTETLLVTSDNSTQTASNSIQQVTVAGFNNSIISLNTSDRLVVKIYAQMVSASATIRLYYDDNTDARLDLPFVADAAAHIPWSDTGTTVVTTYGLDTTRAGIESWAVSQGYATTAAVADSVSGRVKYSDTTTMIGTQYQIDTAAANALTRINAKGTVTSIQVVGGTGATVTPTTAVTTSGVYTVTPEVSSATFNSLSNKRWVPRVISSASYTTSVTIPADSVDLFQITAQAGALLFNAPSGTPNNGDLLVIRIKDNGTARALTYNAIFNWSPPSTTVLGKYMVMCFMYNSVTSNWNFMWKRDEP